MARPNHVPIRFGASLRLASGCALFLIGAALSSEARAYSGNPAAITGMTLRDGNGCVSCHGATADASITAAITGPLKLAPGQSATYTLTVNKAIADSTVVGAAFAASDSGTPLAVFPNEPMFLQASGVSPEIIHHAGIGPLRKTFLGWASYRVTYTMPAGAAVGSTHTLYAVAHVGGGAGWAHAPNFTITVPTPAPRYVDAGAGVNTGNCSISAAPCKTITYAMGQAATGAPGDTISVAPGTYDVALGEVFPITLTSGVAVLGTGGPKRTIIDGAGAHTGVFQSTGGNNSTRIEGFTIQNGRLAYSCSITYIGSFSVAQQGGAIYLQGGDQTRILRNIFKSNEVRGRPGACGTSNVEGHNAYGGAIYSVGSTPVIQDNVFSSNIARGGDASANGRGGSYGGSGYGGAVYLTGGGTLTNNTFHDNRAIGGRGSGGCCFSSNTGPGGSGYGGALYLTGGGTLTNNTFHGNQAIGGNGGIASADNLGSGGNGGNGSYGAVYTDLANVVNNIFANNSAIAGIAGTGGHGASTNGNAAYGSLQFNNASATNNLFFASNPGGDTVGTASVNGDPLFHGAPTNLRIAVGSPANGAGTASGAPSTDITGATRLNPPAIGAYEADGAYLGPTDFNDNGLSDILWRNDTTGQVYRMLMSGFTIANAAMVYQEPDTAWKIVADADFNGDGVSDLLWRNDSTGQVYLMPFTASGFPGAGSFIHTEADPAWKIAFTPDLDGDGMADILWYNTSTGEVYAMLMNGFTITAQGLVYQQPNTQWRIEAVGDFTGAGKANQLVWRNASTGDVWIVTVNFANGAFTQTSYLLYNATPPYRIVAAGDFNGDGVQDILWRNDTTGAVWMQIMGNGQIVSQGLVYQEPNTAWKFVAAGDYNGDGKADILWRNDSTGQVYLMLMNGLTIANAAMIYQEANIAWKILGPAEYRLP